MSDALKTVVLGNKAVKVPAEDVAAIEQFKTDSAKALADAESKHEKALADKDAELAKLQANLNQLLGRLKTKYAHKSDTLQKISELETQVAALQQSGAHDPRSIQAKQQELAELQRKISHLELSLGY